MEERLRKKKELLQMPDLSDPEDGVAYLGMLIESMSPTIDNITSAPDCNLDILVSVVHSLIIHDRSALHTMLIFMFCAGCQHTNDPSFLQRLNDWARETYGVLDQAAVDKGLMIGDLVRLGADKLLSISPSQAASMLPLAKLARLPEPVIEFLTTRAAESEEPDSPDTPHNPFSMGSS